MNGKSDELHATTKEKSWLGLGQGTECARELNSSGWGLTKRVSVASCSGGTEGREVDRAQTALVMSGSLGASVAHFSSSAFGVATGVTEGGSRATSAE